MKPPTPSGAYITVTDEPESTYYTLNRPGHPPLSSPWPLPLLLLSPDAKFLGIGVSAPPVIYGNNDNHSRKV